MAPYNTRGSKRKREQQYQDARAAFGLDPAPMEEALEAEREHQAVAAAETAVAAEAFRAAFAGWNAEDPVDSRAAADVAASGDKAGGGGGAAAAADVNDEAAFFNVNPDVIHEADARALDQEDIDAGRVPRRAATAATAAAAVAANQRARIIGVN